MAAALGPAPSGAKLVLEALAVVQAELTATIAAARADVARELAALPNARGAVRRLRRRPGRADPQLGQRPGLIRALKSWPPAADHRTGCLRDGACDVQGRT